MTREHHLTNVFKVLMSIALLLACMPSFLRLGDSRASLSYVYIIMCLVILFVTVLKDKTMLSFFHYQARKNKLLFICVLALYLLHMIRFMISPDDGVMSRSFTAVIIFTTCYLCFSFLFYNDKNLFERFYYLITIGLILNLFVVLLQKNGFNLSSSYYDGDRYSGLFSHPNQLAIIVSTTFLFYVSNFLAQTRLLKKTFAIVMVFACFMMMLLAGSKTNVVVSLIVLIAYFSFPISSRNIAKFLGGILFLSFAAILITQSNILLRVNPRLFEVLTTLSLDDLLEYRTIVSRIELWDYSWGVGTRYPYLGEGFNSSLPPSVPHSHNLFIDYLRIFGPAGTFFISCFLCSLVFYRTSLGQSRVEDDRASVCKLSIVAYILANMMSDSMGPQTVFFLAFFVSYLSVHSSMAVAAVQHHSALRGAEQYKNPST